MRLSSIFSLSLLAAISLQATPALAANGQCRLIFADHFIYSSSTKLPNNLDYAAVMAKGYEILTWDASHGAKADGKLGRERDLVVHVTLGTYSPGITKLAPARGATRTYQVQIMRVGADGNHFLAHSSSFDSSEDYQGSIHPHTDYTNKLSAAFPACRDGEIASQKQGSKPFFGAWTESKANSQYSGFFQPWFRSGNGEFERDTRDRPSP